MTVTRKPTEYMERLIEDVIQDHGYEWHVRGLGGNDPDGKTFGKCFGCGVMGGESVYEFTHETNCTVGRLQAALDEVK